MFNKYWLASELCPVALTHTPVSFCSLMYHGRVRTVYLFSLCVVSLLSSRFIASELVRFSNFLKYLVFHFLISLSTVFICRSSWITWLFAYQGAFKMDRRVLD
jgi:hypothetical protein